MEQEVQQLKDKTLKILRDIERIANDMHPDGFVLHHTTKKELLWYIETMRLALCSEVKEK